ncbi:hypothetical protein [Methanosarcina siciliae]|nr:hypothetical protein [Methanosarcina siciliae]
MFPVLGVPIIIKRGGFWNWQVSLFDALTVVLFVIFMFTMRMEITGTTV